MFTPCVWDCYSAKAAEMAGFKAILLSGASLGFSMSGVPDLGLHNQEELVWATDRISDYSPLPLIIDADDCFGDVAQAYRTCRRLAKAGAAAILLEDTPNERGYARFGRAMEAATLAGKLDGNVAPMWSLRNSGWRRSRQRWTPALARTASSSPGPNRSWRKASTMRSSAACAPRILGPKMTYVHGLRTLDECKKVARALPGWKMFGDVATVNGVPFVELDDIAALGFNLVTMHYLEKGSMYGMIDFGRQVFGPQHALRRRAHHGRPDARRSSATRWNATAAGWKLKRNGKSYDASVHPRHGSAVRLTWRKKEVRIADGQVFLREGDRNASSCRHPGFSARDVRGHRPVEPDAGLSGAAHPGRERVAGADCETQCSVWLRSSGVERYLMWLGALLRVISGRPCTASSQSRGFFWTAHRLPLRSRSWPCSVSGSAFRWPCSPQADQAAFRIALRAVSSVMLSVPTFVIVVLLGFVFAIVLRWLPATGWVSFSDAPIGNLVT